MLKVEISGTGHRAFDAALYLLHTHPLYVIVPLALMFLAGVLLKKNHRSGSLALKGALTDLIKKWTAALDKMRDAKILSNPSVISHQVDEYDGQTRVEYEQARKVWSLWLAQRQRVQGLLTEAQATASQIDTSVWWKFSLGRLKKAAASLTDGPVAIDASTLLGGPYSVIADTAEHCEATGAALFEQMLSNGARSRELCDRFTRGLEKAQSRKLQVEWPVDGDGRSTGLPALKGKLAALALPLEPYQNRMISLVQSKEELVRNILRQPLSDWAREIKGLSNQAKALENDVATACSMHSLMLTTSASLQKVQSRIGSLRSDCVPSALSGVVVSGNWRLDEDGYQPDAHIADAERSLTEFRLALESGSFSRLDSLNTSVATAIGTANSLVDKTLEEKAFTERQLSEIDASSTEADRVADRQAREKCLTAYAAQNWGLARKATDAFFELHSKRVGTRLESQKLLADVAEVGAEIQRQADVTSAECDQAYVTLVGRARLLDSETESGQADWDGLTSTINDVRTGRVEGSLVLLSALLKDELDAHNAAKTSLNRLKQDLTDLDANTADRWGGAEARGMFTAVAPAVQEVIASADPSKQDWNKLSERIQQAYTLLSPALKLVADELAIDRQLSMRLSSLTGELLACQQMSYTRSICGQVYGLGIYCPVLEPSKRLARAKELHQQRQYEKMSAVLTEARQAMVSGHLDAWWMCLQALSGSPHPCAQQFAAEQGYSAWEYDAWIAKHTSESLAGMLYNLPQGPGNVHKAQSEASAPASDLPDIKDYAPGGIKC